MEAFLSHVRAVLLTTVPRWETLVTVLPADLLAAPPAPGEWSAAGCLAHLLDAERFVFPVRVRAFLAGEDFPAFDPDAEGMLPGTNDPVTMLTEFITLRKESLSLLHALGEADLPRTARHPELGPVTLEQLLHEWAAHDLMHTVQAERALMQVFLPGTGPWRFYFKDHDAAANTPGITG
jgi:hypothetical protein